MKGRSCLDHKQNVSYDTTECLSNHPGSHPWSQHVPKAGALLLQRSSPLLNQYPTNSAPSRALSKQPPVLPVSFPSATNPGLPSPTATEGPRCLAPDLKQDPNWSVLPFPPLPSLPSPYNPVLPMPNFFGNRHLIRMFPVQKLAWLSTTKLNLHCLAQHPGCSVIWVPICFSSLIFLPLDSGGAKTIHAYVNEIHDKHVPIYPLSH